MTISQAGRRVPTTLRRRLREACLQIAVEGLDRISRPGATKH